MFKYIFNIFNHFKPSPLPVITKHYPTPDISPHRSRSSHVGRAHNRLKPELSIWYKHLSPGQKDYHRATRRMTNHQLTVWNRAGCPGHETMDITQLMPYLQ